MAEQDQALRPVLEQCAPLPDQPLPFGNSERTRQTGQRLPAEQIEGPAPVSERGIELVGGLRPLGAGSLLGELGDIRPDCAGQQAVAASLPVDHRATCAGARLVESLAQRVDVAGQDLVPRARRRGSPDVVQELLVRHVVGRAQDQRGEYRLPSHRAQRQRRATAVGPDRPEQIDPQITLSIDRAPAR